jgi:hypothetical protein
MASSQDGNIGIWSGYTPGDNGWTSQHNSNWDALDALVQPTVKSATTTSPPGSPANGDAYIVPSGATGAWASQTNKIAVWQARTGVAAWQFYSPKNGWTVYDQAAGALKVYNGSVWVIITGPSAVSYNGFRNLLINAVQLVNQRVYASGTATTSANQYTIDRWKVQTSGQSLSWITDANGIPTFTAPAGGVAQVIEGLNIQGGTYVLSWTGTATATVNGTSVSNGGTIALTGGANATVVFSGGTFKFPQIELGVTPTSFDFRSFGFELQACSRYYEKSFPYSTPPAQNAGTTGAYLMGQPAGASAACTLGTIFFNSRKRSAPTVTLYNPSALNSQARNTNANADWSGCGSLAYESSIGIFGTTPAGSSAGQAAQLHWTADAEL